jgi:CheY-like chemotaxis protein
MSNRDKNPAEELPELDWGYEGKARVNREDREEQQVNRPKPKAKPKAAKPQPNQVLVVDDDQDVADVLTAIMECNGYIVKAVNNASDALREIIAADFDAIICDIVMPGMPGDMFYLAVSKLKPYLCERFLFITGHGGDVQIAAFLFRVQRPIVYKPVVMEELVEAVFQMLATNAVAAGLEMPERPTPTDQVVRKDAKIRTTGPTGRPRRG